MSNKSQWNQLNAADLGKDRKWFGKDIWGELVDAAKNITGLDDQQIAASLKDGWTLAEIIRAAGRSVEMVEIEAEAVIIDKIARAKKGGDLTRQQADNILENLVTVIDRLINHKTHQTGGKPGDNIATATPTATMIIPTR